MTKQEFLSFCDSEFKNRGFVKKKSLYLLKGNKNISCAIWLQKSNFSSDYYINVYFFIDHDFVKQDCPSRYDFDISKRIVVMSKNHINRDGRHFLTEQIEIEFEPDELRPFFDKAFEEWIMPPVVQGKSFIRENLGTLYKIYFRQEEVLKKLND